MIGYDEALELMRRRRSVRQFADRPVSRPDINRLLEAARWAPSNHNRQPWKFLVFEGRQQIRALAVAIGAGMTAKLQSLPEVASAYAGELQHFATFFGEAPLLLVALHKQPICGASSLWDGVRNPSLVSGEPLSVAMAVQNILLTAETLGLGTCVLTAPLIAQEATLNALIIPRGFGVTCLIAVGFPAETPEPPRRKSLEHIVEFREDPFANGKE